MSFDHIWKFNKNAHFEHESETLHDLRENLAAEFLDSGFLGSYLLDRLALRIIQLDRLDFVAREHWRSVITPEIEEDSLADISMLKLKIQSAYHPKVNYKHFPNLAQDISKFEFELENQIAKLIGSL